MLEEERGEVGEEGGEVEVRLRVGAGGHGDGERLPRARRRRHGHLHLHLHLLRCACVEGRGRRVGLGWRRRAYSISGMSVMDGAHFVVGLWAGWLVRDSWNFFYF